MRVGVALIPQLCPSTGARAPEWTRALQYLKAQERRTLNGGRGTGARAPKLGATARPLGWPTYDAAGIYIP